MNIIKVYKAVVIGCSSGGTEALKSLLPPLSDGVSVPILIVQHLHPSSDDFIAHILNEICQLTVKLAEDKELLQPGVVYLAPANYHLLVERDQTLALSVDEKVHFSRPSIDVLFESAARVFSTSLIGIILTGANQDGSQGLKAIQEQGGLTIVQDPAVAEVPIMPQAALDTLKVDHVLSLKKIGTLLEKLIETNS